MRPPTSSTTPPRIALSSLMKSAEGPAPTTASVLPGPSSNTSTEKWKAGRGPSLPPITTSLPSSHKSSHAFKISLSQSRNGTMRSFSFGRSYLVPPIALTGSRSLDSPASPNPSSPAPRLSLPNLSPTIPHIISSAAVSAIRSRSLRNPSPPSMTSSSCFNLKPYPEPERS